MRQIAALNLGKYFLFSTDSDSILAQVNTLKKPPSLTTVFGLQPAD
jgi:hypothetical protein